MKKLLVLSVCLVLVLVTGCFASKDVPATAPANEPSSLQAEPPVESKKPSKAEPAEQDTKGTIGDYYVEILGHSILKDADGNDAIVLNIKYTNNSDETTSYLMSISEKLFQDGIQLDSALIFDDSFSLSNSQKDIRPGTTIELQKGYTLLSDSPVEVEIYEAFSFDDTGMVYAVLNP